MKLKKVYFSPEACNVQPLFYMRYLHLIIWLSLFGCSNIDGSVEKRDSGCNEVDATSKKVFLVNNSTSKTYQFTVKKIEIKNDINKSYSTDLHILEPGDEIFLGCDKWLSEIEYLKKDIRRKNPFHNVKMIFPDKSVGNIPIKLYKKALDAGAKLSLDFEWGGNEYGKYFTYDTLLNGQHELYITYKITDSSNQLPRDRFFAKYIVTGQKEIID